MKVLIVMGTRPEAIKLAPLATLLRRTPDVDVQVVSSGQHNEMLKQVLQDFDCFLDAEYHIASEGRTLSSLTTGVIEHITHHITHVFRPDWILVQGDTTTAFASGLVGFYEGIRVGHVEAGLRSYNMQHPFPEEANRKLLTAFATAHFAPTQLAYDALVREHVPGHQLFLTGNTVIDALLDVRQRIEHTPALRATLERTFANVDWAKRVILVTAHRRENHDTNLEHICDALFTLAERGDVFLLFPVHLSPKVRDVVFKKLNNHPAIHLCDPLAYMEMVYVLSRAYLVISDSGGIQEEAPSFGKPVLVMRETTERMEAVHAGTAKLVGADTGTIVQEATRLLDDALAYGAMANINNPFGDGNACLHILNAMRQF
jgi:UDP-N-acetylglucosamine 2-epimerase (non-hydrolysing)